MDEYLSEKEKLEQLSGWLRANVPWIVVGLAVGGLIVGGWRWYQARVDRTGVEAAQSYAQILDAFDRGDRTGGLDQVQTPGPIPAIEGCQDLRIALRCFDTIAVGAGLPPFEAEDDQAAAGQADDNPRDIGAQPPQQPVQLFFFRKVLVHPPYS